MKTLFISLALLIAQAPCYSKQGASDNVDPLSEIINKHIAAHGGADKLASVESIMLSGEYTSFSVVHDFIAIKTFDGKFYSDYNLGKHRVKEGYDGRTYWTIDPWQGFDFPRKMNMVEKNVIMQKAETVTPFFRWNERGYVVTYIGEEVLDGLDMYVLELTRPKMPTETWYLDASTCLEYKYISQWADFTYPLQAESYFDDFREVDGIVFPFFVEQTFSTRHRITQIEDIHINPVTDESLFAMPPCDHMEKLAMIPGTWNVGVEVMTRQGHWHDAGQVVTTFDFLSRDKIQGIIAYDMAFPATNTYALSFNKRTNQYQLVVFSELFSTTDLFHGEITDNMLILDNMPVKEAVSDSENTAREQAFTRYTFSLGATDNITIERMQSSDGGEIWRGTERFILEK